MTFLTYSQILKVRKDNYAPMIIVGYPFDRSTALIAAEVSHIASCFVIDFTGEFSDYFHGDAVILKPNELSCYFDMDSSNRYYINLSFLEPEERYVNLVYILSYHIDLPIYVLGFEHIDQHLLDYISSRDDSRIVLTTSGFEKMDPVMILSIKTLFSDIMVAGKGNIKLFYGNEYIPEIGNVVFVHDGEMFFVSEEKNVQHDSTDEQNIIIGYDLILDDPSVLLKFKDKKIIIPGAYIGYLESIRISGRFIEKYQAQKALRLMEDLSVTERIEITDYNPKLYQLEGYQVELMETDILSAALTKNGLLITNDIELTEKAELLHIRVNHYPYLLAHVR